MSCLTREGLSEIMNRLVTCFVINNIACIIQFFWGWSGGVSYVQLILAYSWARPAILVAGNGRGGMFLFLLFLHVLNPNTIKKKQFF